MTGADGRHPLFKDREPDPRHAQPQGNGGDGGTQLTHEEFLAALNVDLAHEYGAVITAIVFVAVVYPVVALRRHVLDPAGITIGREEGRSWRPSISRNGNGALVVWFGDRGGQIALYGARVSNGAVLDPRDFCVAFVASQSTGQYFVTSFHRSLGLQLAPVAFVRICALSSRCRSPTAPATSSSPPKGPRSGYQRSTSVARGVQGVGGPGHELGATSNLNVRPGRSVANTVVAVDGVAEKSVASIDFGSEGVKRLLLRYAPVEKL